MKNYLLIYPTFKVFILWFLFLTSVDLNAQGKTSGILSTFDGSKHSIFLEILGNGLIFSANYDVRILDVFGARAGIGYIASADGDTRIFSMPFTGNFLMGKNGNYIEIGGGITFITGRVDFLSNTEFFSKVGTLTFMYRRQPVNGGFMWKIGFSPLFIKDNFTILWGGVSLGHCW